MRQLDDIIKDGYLIKDVRPDAKDSVADFSLQSSLRAYCQSALAIDSKLRHVNFVLDHTNEQNKEWGYQYATNACDAIIHFQHFIELYIKGLLLKDSPLLVYRVKNKSDLFYKLVHNQLQPQEYESLNYIECAEAIDTIRAINKVEGQNSRYNYLKNHLNLVDKINTIRNRILHRGAFVIHPYALDELFCGYILPLVYEIQNNDNEYSKVLEWGINLHSNIKPFELLRDEYRRNNINHKKVHVLKLMLAATYRNEIPYFPPRENESPLDAVFNPDFSWIFKDKRNVIAQRAQAEADLNWCRIEKCPICGCDSLLIEYDSCDEEQTETFVYRVSCHYCGFGLQDDLLNPDITNLPLPRYHEML